MGEIVYLNGRLILRSKATISALDYGFLYGFGLFETMRAYAGKVFRLDNHLNRLEDSAELLGLSIEGMELKGAVMDTIKANRLGNARIRITISPGKGAINADMGTCKKNTVLVVAEKYIPCTQKVYRDGFRAVTSSFRRNSLSLLAGLKSTSYLMSVMARQEAKKAGADEAICLNEKGLLAEASMSNIFVVTDGRLRTPSLESGILPGITRQTVLELASRMGISNFEDDIEPDELYKAKEAFLTSSLLEIMPLTGIDDKCINDGRVGSITKKLMAAYKQLVSTELNTI
jgi:branched-chain amino acid aminotransferase